MGASSAFRMYSLERIKEICGFYGHWQSDPYRTYHWSVGEIHRNHDVVNPLVDCLLSRDSNLWAKRIEHKSIDIYTNDRNFYEELSTKFVNVIEQRFEPDENQIDLLDSNSKIIICDKLPHNRYHYRVYLQPHKLKGDVDAKIKYLDWIDSQDKILLSEAVKRWFIKTDWNWDRRYVLVEDEPALLMLKLRNSEVVGTVYNYVIADK